MKLRKFLPGDRFRVISNGFTGEIIDVFTKDNPLDRYMVTWDANPGVPQDYDAIACDAIWELMPELPYSKNLQIAEHPDSVPSKTLGCSHKIKHYSGLNEVFDFCETCGVKL